MLIILNLIKCINAIKIGMCGRRIEYDVMAFIFKFNDRLVKKLIKRDYNGVCEVEIIFYLKFLLSYFPDFQSCKKLFEEKSILILIMK